MAAERDLSPPERYALVKANVDEIPVVQLGITLCDWFGNVPTFADGDGRLLVRSLHRYGPKAVTS
jgi:CCR4-NOT transcription complex subunit 7/8